MERYGATTQLAGCVQPQLGARGGRFGSTGVVQLDLTFAYTHDHRLVAEANRSRLAGASTPDAMRAASMTVLEARRRGDRSTHPFFWGAFVASGDHR